MKISINLLPPIQKKILQTQSILRIILDQQFSVILMMFVVILSLGAINFIVSANLSAIEESNEKIVTQSDYAEVLELHELFKETNLRTAVISDLHKNNVSWGFVLERVGETMPRDIKIDEIRTKDNQVTLSGVAQRVSSLVAFKDRLAAMKVAESECFLTVNVPDQYLVKQNDADFMMTFYVSESCLRRAI